MIPIGGRALAWTGKYLAEVRPKLALGDDDGSLFLTAEGEPFSLDRLTQLASRHVKASGVPKQGACHLFRHTMATLMLEGGADIRYIKAMLGHARLDTTQIYAQVTVRALQAIHAATHPAAGNEPRGQRDDGEAKRIAVTGLLAALDEEVKNVASQSYTSQLQDYYRYAISAGRIFQLVVRQGTELSGPLESLRYAPGVDLLRTLP
jgi:integrase/recombinase XerD